MINLLPVVISTKALLFFEKSAANRIVGFTCLLQIFLDCTILAFILDISPVPCLVFDFSLWPQIYVTIETLSVPYTIGLELILESFFFFFSGNSSKSFLNHLSHTISAKKTNYNSVSVIIKQIKCLGCFIQYVNFNRRFTIHDRINSRSRWV
jgi:hypothetical protein